MELRITKDRQELEQLEEIINKNMKSFYDVGLALAEIKNRELYKISKGCEYKTFEAYCRGVWDFSRRNAYYLIDAAAVIENVNNCSQKPTTESQARPLTKLEPEKQREAWQKVIETAPGGKVTAAHVIKIVKDITGASTDTKKQRQKSKHAISESAVFIAEFAISGLERIEDDDPEAEKAFSMIEIWIERRRENLKMTKRQAWKENNHELFESCRQ